MRHRIQLLILGLFLVLESLFAATRTENTPSTNWYRVYSDSVQGINLDAAMRYLSVSKLKPKGKVVVGVIDSGVDTTSIDLKSALWVNQKEIPGDGIDNDRNGYTDDVHGWNFLGTKDGSFQMTTAGTEEYRQFKRLYPKYKSLIREQAVDKNEFDFYQRMKKKAGITGYLKFYQYTQAKHNQLLKVDSALRLHFHIDTLQVAQVMRMESADSVFQKALQALYVDLMKADKEMKWTAFVEKQNQDLDLMKRRIEGIEKDADKRLLMGDDMTNAADRFYGNNILTIDGCYHGTFVAGVIAGQGIRRQALRGVYPKARVLIIRAAPDGDEYDKDISSSIYYAVENGAKVINISLGKYTSPTPEMVNNAIAYALTKDVVVIQAAGNDHLNIDTTAYYPTGLNRNGVFYGNFLRVGASTKRGLCSSISNYGSSKVHLFAPGEDITATGLGNTYATENGTSIAAPVVSGLAALLRSYFPQLKAREVCDVLLRSCRIKTDSKTGIRVGVVDALTAVKLARNYKRK